MKTESIFKYIPYLVIGGIWACMYFGVDIIPNNNCKIFEKYKKFEFNGIVLRTYKDYDNKGFFTADIVTDSDTIQYTQWYTEEPMINFIDCNDSIVKIKDTFDYYIYKQKDKNKMRFVKGHDNCESAYKKEL